MRNITWQNLMKQLILLVVAVQWSSIFAQYGDDLFTRTYGLDGIDYGSQILQLDNGGYIFIGVLETMETNSQDLWLVQLDSTGNLVWQENYGGQSSDRGRRVIPGPKGSYLLAGYTQSYGNGGWDGWLVKIDSTGSVIWDKTYGDSLDDYIFDVIAGEDNGYICTGAKTSIANGYLDFWVFKVDSQGTIEWESLFGGDHQDQARSIVKSSDGGYLVSGLSDRVPGGPFDIWLVKLESNGDSLWSMSYGGPGRDASFEVMEMENNNIIVVGYTETEERERDVQIIISDDNGNILNTSIWGGLFDDEAHGLNVTNDGNYIITGFTESDIPGEWDLILLKVDEQGEKLWSKIYGGSEKDHGLYVFQDTFNRYICFGYTESYGRGGSDAWLIWTDENGEIIPPSHSATPYISDIVDIPNDQGGWVEVEFYRSEFDTDSLILPKAAAPELYTVEIDDGSGWMAAATTVAFGKSTYSVLVPTTKDSTSDDNGLIDFRVIAGMEEGNFASPVATGYSVDNLKPEVPSGVGGSVSEGNKILLSWQANLERDLDHYTVYRSENGSSFEAVAHTSETEYTDNDIMTDVDYGYTITASDYSGNESSRSEIIEFTITNLGAEIKLPLHYYLSQNYPNPFNPETTIKYGLLNSGEVTIRVFDILGNLVTELLNQYQNKGRHQVIWNGKNNQNEQVSSGIYYYQLVTQKFQDIRKMVLVR